MAIDIKRKSIVREDDGTLSLCIAYVETANGKEVGTDTVQGADAAELEAALSPKIVIKRDKYLQEKQLKAQADARLDQLKIDLKLPADI